MYIGRKVFENKMFEIETFLSIFEFLFVVRDVVPCRVREGVRLRRCRRPLRRPRCQTCRCRPCWRFGDNFFHRFPWSHFRRQALGIMVSKK